jgi:hypothetical protein
MKSKTCTSKFSVNVRTYIRCILKATNKFVEISFTEQYREILIVGNVLDQTNDVVSSNRVNFLVFEIRVGGEDLITNSVMLSHEDRMDRCQPDVLIDTKVT